MSSSNNIDKLKVTLKKTLKPTVVCICALFIVSMFSVLAVYTVNAVSITPALHTSGHNILDTSNNVVYLRGIGRAGDMERMTGLWSGPGDIVFDYSDSWETDTASLKLKMDQTFASYRDYWKVNMVRLLVPVDWWWEDHINPQIAYGQGPNQVMSYRDYIELVVQEADKYGLYVDFCPYEVRNYYVSGGQWDGIPGSLGTASLAYMQTINIQEMQAWRTWWTSVVNRLGTHSNVVFEMWNEPDNDKQLYYNYMIEMYKTIRAMGNDNLIFMQYFSDLLPTYRELEWIPEFHNQLKVSIGNTEPVNIAYTTHPYRRSPYPNLQWATTYQGVKDQLNLPNMIPITRSNGIDVPLVFNEMGVMADPAVYNNKYYPRAQSAERQLSVDQRMQNELSFWQAILQNAKEMGIGVCAYYWMQTGVWSGWEALISSPVWDATSLSPTPSKAGQIFIDSSTGQPPTPTPSPTPTLTSRPKPTPR